MCRLEAPSRLKVSRYLVVSERVFTGESSSHPYRLVLSTRSGQALFLSPLLARDLLEGRVPEDPRVIEPLEAAELLIAESGGSEFDEMRDRNARAVAAQSTRTFTIVPTAFCNMGCVYCGQSHAKKSLTSPLSAAVEERVVAASALPSTSRVHICWFGGEPLAALATIEALSRRIIPQVAANGADYSSAIVTNGVLLTVPLARRLAMECGVNSITITLDGPRAAHDASRPLKNGRSSHSSIMRLLSELAGQEDLRSVSFIVRMNVSSLNSDALIPFFADCAAQGLAAPNVSFNLSPVYPWSNDVSAIELERDAYAARESDFLLEMMRLGLRAPILPVQPHRITCVAVDPQAEVIGPDGSLFSCTEQVLVPALAGERLGSVSQRGPRPAGRYGDFNAIDVGKLPCANCVMFGICGGACPKHWAEGVPPCPSYKYNIQERLDLAALQAGMRIA